MKWILKQIIIAAFIILGMNPFLAYAQQTPNTATTGSQQSLPAYNAGVDQSISDYLCTPSQPADGHDLERCVNRLYRFSVTAGAIVVVFFVVLAGYMYITGGETGKGKGKAMLFNALTGIGIILISYVLLYFINPSLVVIKPIQPPIFTADDLPTCAEVGLGDDCIVHGDGVENVTDGVLAKGTAIACKGGIIDTPASLPHSSGATKICKDLADQLAGLKALTPGIDWLLNSTIHGTHTSGCHSPGNANSGNCADIAMNGGRIPSYVKDGGGSTNPKWGQLCQALLTLGKVNFANEASNQPSCEKIKAYKVEKYTTGPNLHVNYMGTGGGGSSSTTSSTSGGSRPYCIAIYKFLCAHPSDMPGSGTYPDHKWSSPHKEIQANLNELKKICKAESNEAQCLGYSVEQVYRPPEYSAHMRSVYEAYALLVAGWTDDKVSHHGQYCNGSIQFVKSADVKGIKKGSVEYNYILDHFNTHLKPFGGLDANTTCLSDHGKGIAVDFTSPNKVNQQKLLAAGLCHNIPKGVASATKPDEPHWVLKSKANTTNCSY